MSKLAGVVGENPREPLQCWKCGGPHMRRNCPLESENARPTYNIQGKETLGQVARVVPMILCSIGGPPGKSPVNCG